jgi:hypothetical protein
MRRWMLVVLAASAVLCARAASGQPKPSVLVGTRDETDSTDVWPAIGVGADFGNYRWRVRPEIGLAGGFDPFGDGHETELFAGAVTYWHRVRARLHLGGGLSDVSSDWGPFDGSSSGLYLRGGASWPVRRHWLGLDVRYLDADDLETSGGEFPVGYLQVSLLFGW